MSYKMATKELFLPISFKAKTKIHKKKVHLIIGKLKDILEDVFCVYASIFEFPICNSGELAIVEYKFDVAKPFCHFFKTEMDDITQTVLLPITIESESEISDEHAKQLIKQLKKVMDPADESETLKRVIDAATEIKKSLTGISVWEVMTSADNANKRYVGEKQTVWTKG